MDEQPSTTDRVVKFISGILGAIDSTGGHIVILIFLIFCLPDWRKELIGVLLYSMRGYNGKGVAGQLTAGK